jgi:hypothetical protein
MSTGGLMAKKKVAYMHANRLGADILQWKSGEYRCKAAVQSKKDQKKKEKKYPVTGTRAIEAQYRRRDSRR